MISGVRFYRIGFLFGSMAVLVGICGCGETNSPTSTAAPVPASAPTATAPVKHAAATESTYRIAPSELRRRLQANERAKFQISGNDIVRAELFQSGVRSLEALKGIPLQFLDLGMTDVSDLSPLEGMPLRELILENTPVSDISVLKGMKLEGLKLQNTKVSDLSVLNGMPLKELNLMGVPVTDLQPFAGMPLVTLWVPQTQVSDLSPVADCRLVSLDVQNTKVKSLEPLREMKTLQRLNIADTEIDDVTPLKDLSLQRITFTPGRIRKGIEVLREMKSLNEFRPTVETSIGREEFWKRYDLGVYNEVASEPSASVPAAESP